VIPTPTLDSILMELVKKTKFDTPEWERLGLALDEFSALQSGYKEEKEAHEASSKCVYDLQFKRLEPLLDKWCEARKILKEAALDTTSFAPDHRTTAIREVLTKQFGVELPK
jgi:hypothetical protein